MGIRSGAFEEVVRAMHFREPPPIPHLALDGRVALAEAALVPRVLGRREGGRLLPLRRLRVGVVVVEAAVGHRVLRPPGARRHGAGEAGHVARGSGTRAPVLVTERDAPPHLFPVLLGVVVVSVMEGEAELLSQCHAHAGLSTPCTSIMYSLHIPETDFHASQADLLTVMFTVYIHHT